MLAKAGTAAATLLLCFLLIVAAASAAVVSLLTGGLGLGGDGSGTQALQPGSDTRPITCRVDGGIHGSGIDLSAQQAANAAVINQVGLDEAVTPADTAVVIALATALQESGLENLDHGDRDSLGLFQQRPSQGWGTPSQIMNPAYAAQQFYRHLERVPHWWSIPLWQAAQAVQRSGAPTAYQKWQPEAAALQHFLATDPNACAPDGK